MNIITLLLMLFVIAVIIYCVKLAFAGNWQRIAIVIISVILILWVLAQFGLQLPLIPKN